MTLISQIPWMGGVHRSSGNIKSYFIYDFGMKLAISCGGLYRSSTAS